MRKSGVLMHISSLPGKYGIGSMGKEAREFADFLSKAGQSFWQVLPVCPTSFADSPYQSFCSEAGNPYFIDLELLKDEGLLKETDHEGAGLKSAPDKIDYGALYSERYKILRKAADKFLEAPDEKYKGFCRQNAFWLDDYALFMTLKDANSGKPWYEWEKPFRNRQEEQLKKFSAEHKADIRFWKTVQYFFFKQWSALKEYANEKGISIIGDLPIYVSLDSVYVWASPELFQLDEDKNPEEVSGCPPDAFTQDGQLWGNPLYDWEYMAEDGYSWWIKRIGYMCGIFDVLRIDHFRGFEAYYAIPAGEKTARKGRWRPGPGIALFDRVKEEIGNKQIIAEDLGFLTPQVHEMLEKSGYPGMKVLEFAFDSSDPGKSSYLPQSYPENCIAYIGTHDNETALGWYASMDDECRRYVKTYMGLNDEEGASFGMIRSIMTSKAKLTIIQAQDILELGNEARMNTPSTKEGNWLWRALPGSFSDELAKKLAYLTKITGRA